VVFLSMPSLSSAMPEYSARTGQSCKTCHIEAQGGALTGEGLQYAASGYVWPPRGGYRVLGPIRKPVRLLIGYLHLSASFIWFGAILYVHILLRPGYALRGLPRGEVFMGLVSMGVVGTTGVFLTLSRVRGLEVLTGSPWGMILSVKSLLYALMVGTALAAVFFLGPRLKRGMTRTSRMPEDGVFDPQSLSSFDGKEGRKAFIAYKDRAYDVTGLRLWKTGTHMKHLAGSDLTEALPRAPHGEEKLEPLKTVGSFDESRKPPRTTAQKAFYVIAYLNLSLVFLVLFVLALWRWGL
jgi:predicted heme/steroid binding protein